MDAAGPAGATLLNYHCGVCGGQLTDAGALFTSCGHFFCAHARRGAACTRLTTADPGRCEQCGETCNAGVLADKAVRYDDRVRSYVFSDVAATLRDTAEMLDFRYKHAKILSENVGLLRDNNSKLESSLARNAEELSRLKAENDSLREALRRSEAGLVECVPVRRERADVIDVDENPSDDGRRNDDARAVSSQKRERPISQGPARPTANSRYAGLAAARTRKRDAVVRESGFDGGHRLDPKTLSQFAAHRADHAARSITSVATRSYKGNQFGALSNTTAPLRNVGNTDDPYASKSRQVAPISARTELDDALARGQSALRRSSGQSLARPSSSVAAAGEVGRRLHQRPSQFEGRAVAGPTSQALARAGTSSRGGLPPSSLSRFARTSSRGVGPQPSSPRFAPKMTPLTRLGLGSGNVMPRPSATPQRLSRPVKRMRPLHNPVVGRQ